MNIDTKICGKIIIAILTMLVLFHLAILSGLLPMNIVWGGRLQDKDEMILLELFAIFINALIILLVSMRLGFIKNRIPPRALQVSIWVISLMFTTNIFTNLMAYHWFEKWVMGTVTIILSFLFIRLALLTKGKKP